MSERHALIVNDHPAPRMLARTWLTKIGWSVQEADSCETALKCAGQTSFSLVLLDVSLYGLSSENICSALRKTERNDGMRIIAYTAHASPEQSRQYLSLGFDDVLVRPFNSQRLEELSINCKPHGITRNLKAARFFKEEQTLGITRLSGPVSPRILLKTHYY